MIFKKDAHIYYIIEPIDWSVKWDGYYITKNLRQKYNLNARTLKVSKRKISGLKNKIMHFGSRNIYLPEYYKYVDKSNKIILTWFHGTDEDINYIDQIPKVRDSLQFVHTSCTITKNYLVKWGFPERKIIIISIGVDTNLFQRKKNQKKYYCKKFGIPEGHICIGSFQKDGNGWGEGNTPKLIKGPDIFCDVLNELQKNYPIFVLLSGPARGYVKKRLAKDGIPFRHLYLKNYKKIPTLYNALDLYLITSRAEGGPKAMMESFASGVPLVSTDVGMVHDYGIDGENLLKTKIEDTNGLVEKCRRIIEDNKLREEIIRNGLRKANDFSWENIAKQYYEKIYSKLIS